MKQGDQTLARLSAQRAKLFVLELVNLGGSQAAARRLRTRFSDVLPTDEEILEDMDTPFLRETAEMIDQTLRIGNPGMDGWHVRLNWLRDDVRRAWNEPDLRTREYVLFLLQLKALEGDNRLKWSRSIISHIPSPLPYPSRLEQAFAYLRKSINRANYCKNQDCPAPYFFSSRRNQRYCTEACAEPAQREYKRQWWAEHGEAWRASRKKDDKRSKKRNTKGRK